MDIRETLRKGENMLQQASDATGSAIIYSMTIPDDHEGLLGYVGPELTETELKVVFAGLTRLFKRLLIDTGTFEEDASGILRNAFDAGLDLPDDVFEEDAGGAS